MGNRSNAEFILRLEEIFSGRTICLSINLTINVNVSKDDAVRHAEGKDLYS